MNTYFGLLAEFDGRSELPLDEVAPRYFGISPRTASIRAGAQALPVPTYRAGDSQKSPWLVSAMDLAQYLDKKRGEAHKLWKQVNGESVDTCCLSCPGPSCPFADAHHWSERFGPGP